MEQLKDNVPPHNSEAEQATLGALLLDWKGVLDSSNIFKTVSPEDFYSLQNQLIFKAMMSLAKKSVRCDTITLIDELTKSGDIERAGGAAYVASLTNVVPTSANVLYYAKIVSDMAMRRALIKAAAEIKASSFDESREVRLILDDAERRVFALREQNNPSEIHNMEKLVTTAIANIEARQKSDAPFTGVPSGFSDLDNKTSGFQNSELIVIGARPSMGKTALALSMMEHIAVTKKIPCAFFSLEMSYEAIAQRLLSQVSRVPIHRLRSGLLRQNDMQSLVQACGMWYEAPLWVVDTPNMQLLDISAMARRIKAKHDVRIVFIDYIGLISTDIPNSQVWERVSEITRSLKALARELDIPIVALSQVSRDAEGQEPTLAQLRGSGSVEQDADVVMFIHRDRGGKEDDEKPVQDAKIILAKQRNGATGNVRLVFFKECTRFENATADER